MGFKHVAGSAIIAATMVLAPVAAGATTFVFTGSVQRFTADVAADYDLEAIGASGGNGAAAGGLGGTASGRLYLAQGTVIEIFVGGIGAAGALNGGGGGGTFVRTSVGLYPLIVAGGGGGGGPSGGDNASTLDDIDSNGYGGSGGYNPSNLDGGGGGGAGYRTNGEPAPGSPNGGGIRPSGGAAGGTSPTGGSGGYGGGGAGGGVGGAGGGGGGGYRGGDGGTLGGGYAGTSWLAEEVTNRAGGSASTAGNGRFTIAMTPAAGVVPEPATWAMMLTGFGAIGAACRRRRRRRRDVEECSAA